MAGIYVHIPFCKSRCSYCDFFSGTSLARKEELLAALHDELSGRSGLIGIPARTRIDTLYFGGGTPSLLTPGELGALVTRVRALWADAPLSEVTAEANPDDLTPAYLDALRRAGINRLSIGIQSFIDRDLQWMHRRHDSSAAKEAVRAARRAGFDNLTIDLIYGLPQMTAREWRYNLEQALALEVEHLSAYHLTIEPQTLFGRQAQRGTLAECDPEKSREQFDLLHGMLEAAGYEHYEVSNFARPGRRALHNSNYWNGVPYLGVGPSAHSYDGACRQWNVAHLSEYLLRQPSGTQYQTEELTPEMQYNEYVMTRLRTADGLSAAELEERFGAHKLHYFVGQVQKYIAAGTVMLREDTAPKVRGAGICGPPEAALSERNTASRTRYYIPATHFLISDSIISDLFIV